MNPAYRRAALAVTIALGMLSVVPAVAFAANPACGTTIMSNVTLTADMDCTASGTDGIIFGKKGLTLNLNGHTIWGPTGADSYSGVNTNDKKHVTVKNGTISDFGYAGLYLVQSVGGTFKNLTIHGDDDDSSPDGVYVYYGSSNVLNNLTIDNFYIGIDMYGSAHNWVTNNHITNSYYGIYDEYNSLDTFINNYAEYSYAGFYEDYSGGQTWKNNVANGDELGGYYGFYFDCYEYGIVTAIGNETWGNSNNYGFYVYECYDYYNSSTAPSLLRGNYSHDNPGEAYGFYDYYSIRAVWENNVSKRNGSYGFYMDYPGFVVFRWNIANRNGDDGIYATDNYGSGYGNYASFVGNKANYNEDYGIDADYGISNASGNKAKGNGNAPDNCYNVDCNV
jgi:parallel beta-helix repeat protein